MQINNFDVISRFNRPSYNQRVALELFFVNDGYYSDPYEISSVALFTKSSYDSSTLLASGTQIVSATPLMGFANSATLVTDSAFDSSNYSPVTTASGIYKLGTGHYSVVLDNTLSLSGEWDGSALAASGASAVNEYVDIWAVKHSVGSNYIVYINDYRLFDDTFIGVTQRLLTSTRTNLITKSFELGERKDLIFTNEVTVLNKDIDESIKNIFRDSVITSGAVEITKLNEGNSLPSQVEVSGFSDTSSSVIVTANNEVIFNLDTDDLETKAATTTGFGSPIGVYSARVKFTILNEEIISPPLTFKVS